MKWQLLASSRVGGRWCAMLVRCQFPLLLYTMQYTCMNYQWCQIQCSCTGGLLFPDWFWFSLSLLALEGDQGRVHAVRKAGCTLMSGGGGTVPLSVMLLNRLFDYSNYKFANGSSSSGFLWTSCACPWDRAASFFECRILPLCKFACFVPLADGDLCDKWWHFIVLFHLLPSNALIFPWSRCTTSTDREPSSNTPV